MKNFFIISLFLTTLFPFIIAPENPGKSSYPGGYISLGLQLGEDNNFLKFRSYQINIGTSIGSPLMLGFTFGKRVYKNKKSYFFCDFQGNIIFLGGAGIGIISENKNIYFRKKLFVGLGPFMYSKDWVNYRDKRSVQNSGLMIAFPFLTIFGNSFHP